MTLQSRIEQAITETTGDKAEFASARASYGGSINESSVHTLQDGRRFFVKTNPHVARLPGMFAAEYEALALLAAVNIIRVPNPVVWTDEFIVMGRPMTLDRVLGSPSG